jgi:hypothetical protein
MAQLWQNFLSDDLSPVLLLDIFNPDLVPSAAL